MANLRSFILPKLQNKYSLLAILVYAIIAFTHRDSFRSYNNPNKILIYDLVGYYAYLPGFFIHGDSEFSFLDNRKRQSVRVEVLDVQGDTVLMDRYPVGPAILATPFFLLGHLEAYYQQVPQNGFSYTYMFWIITGCIFYVILSLFLLRSIMLRYFKDAAVATTLLALGLGTNLLYYTMHECMMSHIYSFFLFSLALYLSIKWLDHPKRSTMLYLALSCGMIAVTRLPNMVYFLVIVFWGVYSKESLIERLLLYKKHWVSVVLGLFVFLIPFIPQITYWYLITGKFYVNSYGDNSFFFTKPMIAEVLIGYRKGWLIYTPIMIFGFWGFYYLYQQQKELFWTVFLYAIINIYIVSSWNWWWYGGSFGMRALVECAVAFSLPMAAMFQQLGKHPFSSHITGIVVAAFIGLNMFQTYQYDNGIIHHQAMSRKSYWTVFGVTAPAHKHIFHLRNKHLIRPNVLKEIKREEYKQTIW